MSLFQDLKTKAMGLKGQHADLFATAKNAYDVIQQNGGVQGLKAKFEKEGMGHTIQSWISTGENKTISPEQIQKVLGSDTIKNFASKAGTSPEQISQQLAKFLPKIIDTLTPNGKVSDTPLTEDSVAKAATEAKV